MRNLKKVLALVLTLALALSVAAGAAFTDQKQIKNTEAVDACVALNIIGGYPDGSYKPEGNITRAEFTKMLCVLLNGGKEPTLGTAVKPTFSDVSTSANAAWAEKYIESCVAQGIVSGIGGGKFAPNSNVTGSQAAKMLLVALGYKSDIETFTGAAWEVNVNVIATKQGLYKGLEGVDTSKPLTRDAAAQMVWNALQAKEVKYDYTLVSENGQLVSKTTLVDKVITLLEDKYDAVITKGIVSAIDSNSKGYLVTITTGTDAKTQKDITVDLSKVAKDPTDLVGKAVKAIYKDTDDVYGIYVDDENTATVVTTTLGDIDLKKNEYKLDGVTYKTKDTNFGAVDAVAALGQDLKALKDVKASNASQVVLIDNDGDEKIDVAVVTPVAFGEITYMNAKNITVKGVLTNTKLEDCDIYKDAAKNDQVAVIDTAYDVDGDYVITKLTSVSGKVQATKDAAARIDGTWYDVAVYDGSSVAIDDKGTFYLYNGYIVVVDTTGGSIADTAYIISSSTSMDVEGNYQAKVMMNGETKVVSIHKSSVIKGGAKDMYVTYEVKDGAYKFTKITTQDSGLDGYTAKAVASYKDGRIYDGKDGKGNEYLIEDDAVVYVKYNNDKYSILTGKDVAGWGDKVKNFTGSDSLILYKTSDKMMKVKGAFIDLGTDKMPASTASYAVIVSSVVKATDNKFEFTLWNGTETIDVVTSNTGFAKWQVVEYVKNSDGTYDIDAVQTGISGYNLLAGVDKNYALFSITDHTSSVVQLANEAYAPVNYNITKDTQIIYVDTSASDTEDICVNGGSISDAGTAANGETYRNATFAIDSGKDLDLLVVITNTEGASSGAIMK